MTITVRGRVYFVFNVGSTRGFKATGGIYAVVSEERIVGAPNMRVLRALLEAML